MDSIHVRDDISISKKSSIMEVPMVAIAREK